MSDSSAARPQRHPDLRRGLAASRLVFSLAEEQKRLLENRPDQPQNPKVLRIAIIGAPNAGKSTLSNQLLGRKVKLGCSSGCYLGVLACPSCVMCFINFLQVFPVSKKVHTTRCKARGVITHQDTQLVSPGDKGQDLLICIPWDHFSLHKGRVYP